MRTGGGAKTSAGTQVAGGTDNETPGAVETPRAGEPGNVGARARGEAVPGLGRLVGSTEPLPPPEGEAMQAQPGLDCLGERELRLRGEGGVVGF